ncbi:hypothetical protein K492DRAFT_192159 [Lichtheimia hyalospora FSU 10163]|nr:hypothetical protein K492DRAFT_192159 [Lichtheimia hyalospora FSU 10163]
MFNNNTYINSDIFNALFSEVFWHETMINERQYVNDTIPTPSVKVGSTTASSSTMRSKRSSKAIKSTTSLRKKLRHRLCSNCRKTEDTTWRLDPKTKLPLCNACGLYIRNNKVNRQFDQGSDGSSKLIRHYKSLNKNKLDEENTD